MTAGSAGAATGDWTVQPSSNPGGYGLVGRANGLKGIAATSATNAWAVGSYWNGHGYRTLIEHWDGKAWKVQPSPNPGDLSDSLDGVAATSANNGWAVGTYESGPSAGERTLIERWNGRVWKVQSSPSPSIGSHGSGISLTGVAATSANDAWAVGLWATGQTNRVADTVYQTLIEHWDGQAWKVQPSPNPGISDSLSGVAAAFNSVWAVGDDLTDIGSDQTLVETP